MALPTEVHMRDFTPNTYESPPMDQVAYKLQTQATKLHALLRMIESLSVTAQELKEKYVSLCSRMKEGINFWVGTQFPSEEFKRNTFERLIGTQDKREHCQAACTEVYKDLPSVLYSKLEAGFENLTDHQQVTTLLELIAIEPSTF